MELKEFVEHTLVDVWHGVQEANEELGKVGKGHRTTAFGLVPHDLAKEGGFVEFDVAVTVESGGVAGVRGGVKVAVVSLQAGAEQKSSEQRYSRIRFKVAIRAIVD